MRAACAWVVERASEVRIGSIDRVLEELTDRPVPSWDGRHHYSGPPERVRRYLLVLDTVNFSFWGEGFWGGGAGGYYELAGRLRDVFRGGDDLSEASRLVGMTSQGLRDLLIGLRMIDAPKTLILISEGFVLSDEAMIIELGGSVGDS